MGVVREIYELTFFTTEHALDDSGYVMTFEGAATEGNVRKTESTGTYLTPCGVAYRSTLSRLYDEEGIGDQYLSACALPIIREGETKVKLPATHSAISVGDVLFAADDGRVVKGVFDTTSAATLLADLEKVVGYALEAKAQDAGGKVLTKLELRRGV